MTNDWYAHQPPWLQRHSRQCVKGWEWIVLIEGKRFAIVKQPGHSWSDNGGRHYGPTTWTLYDKQNLRDVIGDKDVHAGRMNKTVKARLQKIVDESDKAGKMVLDAN
jgi:hypothetical protein